MNTSGASGLIRYYNNIYFSTVGTGNGSSGAKLVTGSAAGLALLDFNCYFQAAANYTAMWSNFSSAFSTLASWRTATGAEANSFTSDPAFVFPGGYVAGGGPIQFQLGGASPCLGAGQSGVDMGAWQGQSKIGCDWVTYPV
jgi:hypothetical protein